MTEQEFWEVIGGFDPDPSVGFDEDEAVADIASRLRDKEASRFAEFQEHLARRLFALDTKAHYDEIGESKGSSDAFLYVRCFVVGAGRDHYSRVLADPTLMPKSLDQWFEDLLYVASRTLAEKTGKDEGECELDPSVSYESGSNEEGWR